MSVSRPGFKNLRCVEEKAIGVAGAASALPDAPKGKAILRRLQRSVFLGSLPRIFVENGLGFRV